MPGSRKFMSTRLQMEMKARKETDKKLEEVTSRLDKLQEMMAQLIEQQMSTQKSNTTPNGSGNALQRNLRNGPTLVEELHAGECPHQRTHMMSVVRPYDVLVAKATIQTTKPKAIVAGTPLGAQFCENAHGRSIAWPRDRLKEDKKSMPLPKGVCIWSKSQHQGT
ncbi:hypothetical protein GUJ93_ZPchr0005g15119 [Zizania palustris]|uniref:Transposase Tnp1/En/Spm-like domain-containing protein n=1 Tax=Zizania palustris TaxID=103762 RepID=A0A8J5SCU1_ZIZPA|nr:hypothetical protein GUJ93_ZPchr0005g15119 [Zizania palustris]